LNLKLQHTDHNSTLLNIQISYPFHFEFFSVLILQQVYLMSESLHLTYTSLLQTHLQDYPDTSFLSYTPTITVLSSCQTVIHVL